MEGGAWLMHPINLDEMRIFTKKKEFPAFTMAYSWKLTISEIT
jgi:hypothetical protein